MGTVLLLQRGDEQMTETIQHVGNTFQVLGYIVGPILLGLALFYGMYQTRKPKGPAAQRAQDDATRDLYANEDAERREEEIKVENSSKTIDVLNQKTGNAN